MVARAGIASLWVEVLGQPGAHWRPTSASIQRPSRKRSGHGGAVSAEVLQVGPHAPSLPAGIAARLREIERAAAWGTFRLDFAPKPGVLQP